MSAAIWPGVGSTGRSISQVARTSWTKDRSPSPARSNRSSVRGALSQVAAAYHRARRARSTTTTGNVRPCRIRDHPAAAGPGRASLIAVALAQGLADLVGDVEEGRGLDRKSTRLDSS